MSSTNILTNTTTSQKTTKIFLVCPTLGRVNRGIESFTKECFQVLTKIPLLDVTLFKGAGSSFKDNITLRNLHRDEWLTSQLVRVFRISNKTSNLLVEDGTFFLNLLPYIHLYKPDVVYFSHYNIGSLLWHWRKRTKQNYKLLYRNGGPTGGEALKKLKFRFDHIQQLSPTEFQKAIDAGVPATKQTLLPNAIDMPSELKTTTLSERKALRRKLNLPEKRPLIISVAAINKYHKRLDYVINEVSTLPEPRPYLLLLGQQESETPEILHLGNQVLGSDNFQIRTVNQHEVPDYYQVADAFVLASLKEGLPRVCIEAMSHGLPCLVHDYEVTQFILGEEGYMANFELNGSLTSLIPQALAEAHDISKCRLRHQRAYERFSWEKLCPKYVKLIEQCTDCNETTKTV